MKIDIAFLTLDNIIIGADCWAETYGTAGGFRRVRACVRACVSEGASCHWRIYSSETQAALINTAFNCLGGWKCYLAVLRGQNCLQKLTKSDKFPLETYVKVIKCKKNY